MCITGKYFLNENVKIKFAARTLAIYGLIGKRFQSIVIVVIVPLAMFI